MRNLFASAAILALTMSSAIAADPIGDWLVKEGYAHIRIDICSGKLWGIVAWEKKPGGLDTENPDLAKKERPTLGIPILMGLAQKGPKWQGEIYNSQNGKMYSANVSLADEDTLDLEGCLFTDFLCLTQKWTRIKTPPTNATPLPPIKGAPQTKQAAAKKGPTAAVSDVCLRVADEAAAQEKAASKK